MCLYTVLDTLCMYYVCWLSLKRTMDIVVGGKVVCVCGYGEVRHW